MGIEGGTTENAYRRRPGSWFGRDGRRRMDGCRATSDTGEVVL